MIKAEVLEAVVPSSGRMSKVRGSNGHFLRGSNRSRALAVLLLLCAIFILTGCGAPSGIASAEQRSTPEEITILPPEYATIESTRLETTEPEETTVEARLPEDVLSKDEISKPQERRDWNEPSDENSLSSANGSSAGNIPNVQPFNFGRDPGGPEDKTLFLSIPVLGLVDVPVYNSASEEELVESAVHVPATGFPWQKGANVYIAGHRLGYPNTGSYRIFYELDEVSEGDKILLRDSAGGEYRYTVTETKTVEADNVEVMDAEEGRSLVTLQTCTLPDYSHRIIVQGEMVRKDA